MTTYLRNFLDENEKWMKSMIRQAKHLPKVYGEVYGGVYGGVYGEMYGEVYGGVYGEV